LLHFSLYLLFLGSNSSELLTGLAWLAKIARDKKKNKRATSVFVIVMTAFRRQARRGSRGDLSMETKSQEFTEQVSVKTKLTMKDEGNYRHSRPSTCMLTRHDGNFSRRPSPCETPKTSQQSHIRLKFSDLATCYCRTLHKYEICMVRLHSVA